MASMNYCFTVCRAAEDKAQHDQHGHASSTAIDVPQSSSPGAGAYFFGRFFSFGSPSPVSTMTNPFTLKASDDKDDTL
jgi:hypothetical protein